MSINLFFSAPAPTSVAAVMATKCVDKHYTQTQWYQTRPVSDSCVRFDDFDDPIIQEKGITAEDIIFAFQVSYANYIPTHLVAT